MPHTSSRRAALVVGVGQYVHADRAPPLLYAARDAEAVADLLTDPDLCGFAREQVVLLTEEQATRDALCSRLSSWLVEQARSADLVLLYFAGHGLTQQVGQREEGFLLPHDADPAEVGVRGVAMSDLARWLEGVSASVVICLDCCHSGKLLTRTGVTPRDTPRDLILRPSLLQGLSGRGRFLIASCDEGQQSLEAEELRHGLFTYHLLDGLRGAADRDGDGQVEVAELFNHVATRVAEDARSRYGREQKPWTTATWADKVYLSYPRRAPLTQVPGASLSLDGIWRSQGAEAGLREAERLADDADPGTLIDLARRLGRLGEASAAPLLFRLLAHSDATVREHARGALQRIGWPPACAAVEAVARRNDTSRIADILSGLAACEPHQDVVALLDRLVVLLGGVQRNQALLLRERKAQGLERERMAKLFQERGSPYRIERVLGTGLATVAYLARHEVSGLEVVLRVLRPDLASQPQLRAEFLDLSRRSVRFVHQDLVLTRDVGEYPDAQLYFTIRDYIPGTTLQQLLDGGRRFSPEQVQGLLRRLVGALTPLHEAGVCHGGVKPANLFVRAEGRVLLGEPSLTLPGFLGKMERLVYDYRYAPPELFSSIPVGPAGDLYALGCVAHELLLGRPPFVADTPFELAAMHCRDPLPALPATLNSGWHAFLERLLAKKAGDRYPHLDAVCDALDLLRRPPAGLPFKLDRREPEPLGGASLLEYRDVGTVVPAPGAGDQEPATEWPEPDAQAPKMYGLEDALKGFSIPGYRIERIIGRGGMGAVYLATHERLGRPAAIKVLPAGIHSSEQLLQRFQTEARAIAQLSHPYIVTIFEVGEANGYPFLALEYVPGGSLAQRLRDRPLSPREAAEMVAKLAEAIQHAHDYGILHRDLKPGNILLTERGEPKITDFGLARNVQQEENLTHSGVVMGTPAYMSPEQAAGNQKAIGPATDQYALGCILYELLTGKPPFRGQSVVEILMAVLQAEVIPPRQVKPDVPRDLEAICLKCLARDPDRRYASAGALAEDLRRYCAGEPIAGRVQPLQRGRRWWQPVAAGVGVAMLTALVWYLTR